MDKKTATNAAVFMNRVEIKGSAEVQMWTEVMMALQAIATEKTDELPPTS